MIWPAYIPDIPADVQEAVREVMPALYKLDEALTSHNMPYPGTKLTLYLGNHECVIMGEPRKKHPPTPFLHLGRTA